MSKSSALQPSGPHFETPPYLVWMVKVRTYQKRVARKFLNKVNQCIFSKPAAISYKPFWTYLNLFEPIWTYPNLFEPIQTYLNLSKPIWTYPNLFVPIQTYLYLSKPIWTHPNLFEPIQTYPNPCEPLQIYPKQSKAIQFKYLNLFKAIWTLDKNDVFVIIG